MKTKQQNVFQKPIVVVLLGCLATALWGSASPCIKISYELFRIDPTNLFAKCLLAGVRFTMAGLLIIAAEMIVKRKFFLPPKAELPHLAALGLADTTLQYLLFYTGLAYTTASRGALFSSVDCFFIVLLTPLLIRGEKITGKKLFGCLLGFIGLVLTSVGANISELAGFTLLGDGSVMMASLVYAFCSFYTKKLMTRMSPSTAAGWQMFIGGLVLTVIGAAGGATMYWGEGLKAVVLMGYMCLLSAVAYTVWNILLKNNPISRVAILKLLTPIFGAVISAVMLHETPFTPVNITALALVCSGIWVVGRES